MLVEDPHVVIVIPTENNPEVLIACIRSIYSKIQYCNFEVVVVSVGEAERQTQKAYDELSSRYENFSILNWNEEFNHARIANFAAEQTEGEFLLFLRDDTRVITQGCAADTAGVFPVEQCWCSGPSSTFY